MGSARIQQTASASERYGTNQTRNHEIVVRMGIRDDLLSAVLVAKDRKLMFYWGKGYGRAGFGLAV